VPNQQYEEVVERAQAGDLAAFTELVILFQDLAVGCAYGWLGEIESARDVTQEAFLEAHLHLAQLRTPAAFPGWLRQIVRKHCDRITRRQRLPETPLEFAREVRSTAPDSSVQLSTDERGEHLRLAVEALPAQERLIVALHYFADVSGSHLSDFLELPLSTIKKRLRDARRRIRNEGESLMQETIERMRPSNTNDFALEVAFFIALRQGDHSEVKRLIGLQPELVDAQQQWDASLVFEGVLPFANKATALITAIERDDLVMQTLLIDAGANVDGVCGCVTGESPIWAATLLNRPAHARELLARGANPNVTSASGNSPLHLAAMRGSSELVVLLLEYEADASVRDGGAKFPLQFAPADGQDDAKVPGRTAAQWARANAHMELARTIESFEGREGETTASPPARESTLAANGRVVHTGIKALDLFAPLPRGGLIRMPFKAGVGMLVLLGELCQRFYSLDTGAAIWTGFTQPPYDLGDFEAEMSEFGLKEHIHQSLAGFDETARARRDAFQRGLEQAEKLRDAGRDVLAILLTADGFESDIESSLARLSAASDLGSVTTIVVTAFPEKSEVWSDLEPPYSAQLTLDRLRAQKHLFPAIDPGFSISDALREERVGDRHLRLATAARRLFDWYRELDPDFSLIGQRCDGEDRVEIGRVHRLLQYLAQPFCITEPFTGRLGEQIGRNELLDRVEAILTT